MIAHRPRRAITRATFRAWQDRVRDPSLSVLLAAQIFVFFIGLPLAASGFPDADRIGMWGMLIILTIVVLLSHRGGAILLILVGFATFAATFAPSEHAQPTPVSVLNRGGLVLIHLALAWVVMYAVYAPGRITLHRLQGAVVVYLNFAILFAIAFTLVWELAPDAFANAPAQPRGAGQFAPMFYFSLATLTTTGYGDVVPVNPFARSLANLEAVVGQFYLAVTVARLVTLELEHRRQDRG